MEPSRSFTNFSQLRSALDNTVSQPDVHGYIGAASASSEKSRGLDQPLPRGTTLAHSRKNHVNRRSMRMDELVQDLSSALDESTNKVGHQESVQAIQARNSGTTAAGGGKRRVWRRRCKSTSNLAAIAAATGGTPPASSSKVDNATSSGANSNNRSSLNKSIHVSSTSTSEAEENMKGTQQPDALKTKGNLPEVFGPSQPMGDGSTVHSLQLTEDEEERSEEDEDDARSSGDDDEEDGCDDSIESSCFGDVGAGGTGSQTAGTNPGSAGGSMDSCSGSAAAVNPRQHQPAEATDSHMASVGPMSSKRLTPHYSSTLRKKRANSQKELLDGTMVNVSSNYQSSVLRGGPGRPQQSPNHPGQKRDRLAAGLTHHSGGRPVLPTESDSLNENTFPSVPVHRERDREHKTKRKRKCKRFALDPEQQGTSGKPTYPVNNHGRSFTGDKPKKIRSRSACGALPGTSPSATVRPNYFAEPAPAHPAAIPVGGKRKRSSNRDSKTTSAASGQKEVEMVTVGGGQASGGGGVIAKGSGYGVGLNRSSFHPNRFKPKQAVEQHQQQQPCDVSMDYEDNVDPQQHPRESCSSLSSTDWEDDSGNSEGEEGEGGDNQGVGQPGLGDRRGDDADDEQSDWPGHETSSTSVGPGGRLTLEGTGSAIYSDEEDLTSFQENMTSTARQAYLARMKRLAECVPGREIRAGARRLRTRARGFTIKSSSSEQVSRFLQDGRRTELRLTVIRTSDRTKIAHLANLYSLSLGYEAPCQANQSSHVIVLTKTEKTLQVQDGNEDVAASGSGCRKSLGAGGVQGGATAGGLVGGSNGSAYEVKRRRREEEIAEESSPQPSKEDAQVGTSLGDRAASDSPVSLAMEDDLQPSP